MQKDHLRLKAVNSLSSFFRKAATALDALTSVQAEWEGIFPHPLQFEEFTDSGHTELRYRLGDKLAVEELALKHNAHGVFLSINPICREYVISNFETLRDFSGAVASNDILEKYSGLRWDTASADEMKAFFLELFGPRTSDTDFWAIRAGKLFGLVFAIAKDQATHEGKVLTAMAVRDLLPLDRLLEVKHSCQIIAPELAEELARYLFDLPGYSEDDAINGSVSTMVYQHHGYLTMQVTQLFSASGAHAFTRDYRLRATEIDYHADAPISSVSAKVEDNVLVVSVKYVDTRDKKVVIAV